MMNKRPTSASCLYLIASILLLICVVADRAESEWAPKIEDWVNDTANVLSVTDRKLLSSILSYYNQETHHQLVVLTIPTLAGESIETFSRRVANASGIGYKGLDNGILVTIAIKERSVRIELGKGMERYISNSTTQSIITTSMIPAFRKGDFAGGLECGIKRLMEEARSFIVKDSDLPLGRSKQ